MTTWTDAHCHLQERYLSGDPAVVQSVSDTLARARAGGVGTIIVVGTDAVTSREAMALAQAESTPEVALYATVGLHPHDALSGLDEVAALARRGDSRLVGVGECGLDYYYEHSPREIQKRVFADQIQLAHELHLALVIHARDAWSDLFDILDAEGTPERTVIHCFTGGPNEAAECLRRGADISVAGVVTFKNAHDLRDAVLTVPLDRLHVETDSPFLAPVPYRGTTNEPAYVADVGTFIAALRGEDLDEFAAATRTNTARLFALPR